MDEPPKDLLVFAFLCALVRLEKGQRERGRPVTFEQLVERWGIGKGNLIKMNKPDRLGTLGTELLFRVADAKFHGSVDLMVSHARSWWAGLTPEKLKFERPRLDKAREQREHRERPETSPEDQAEIDRLRDELKMAAAHSAPRLTTREVSAPQRTPGRAKRR